MRVHADKEKQGSPELIVGRLAHRLRSHALLDALFTLFPPVLALFYLLAFFYHLAWITAVHALLLGCTIVIGLLAVVGFRPRVASLSRAARLVDDKAEAKDRFITLTTLGPAPASGALVERLRFEASGLLNRIEIRRDFPYTLKRSFYRSMIGSVAAMILLHLLLIAAQFTNPGVSPQQRIRELAEQMAQKPPLTEIARGLKALSAKLDDPQALIQEKQPMIQEMQKQVEEQQSKEQQQENKDLLSDASSTLKSLEQEAGGAQQQAQQNEGGGVQSDASQEGQGEGQSQGNDGDSKGEVTAQMNPDTKNGKSTKGDPQGQGQQKNPRDQNEQKVKQSDPSNPDKSNSTESAGKVDGGSEGKSGKNRPDEMPQNGPPAERFYKPGEQGREGIKGARYVTVQLPEELAADGNGIATTSKDGKESRNRSRLPVSNVPLPAHMPEAPTEKQRMPLEYRDLIR